MELKSYSDTKVVGSAKIEKPILEADVNYIVSGAFEGGSNYWASINKNSKVFEKRDEKTFLTDFITDVLLEGGEIKINELDEDGEFENVHALTLDKLIKGVALNASERPHDNYFNDNHDAETYDCILQYALFGKLVYG